MDSKLKVKSKSVHFVTKHGDYTTVKELHVFHAA